MMPALDGLHAASGIRRILGVTVRLFDRRTVINFQFGLFGRNLHLLTARHFHSIKSAFYLLVFRAISTDNRRLWRRYDLFGQNSRLTA